MIFLARNPFYGCIDAQLPGQQSALLELWAVPEQMKLRRGQSPEYKRYGPNQIRRAVDLTEPFEESDMAVRTAMHVRRCCSPEQFKINAERQQIDAFDPYPGVLGNGGGEGRTAGYDAGSVPQHGNT